MRFAAGSLLSDAFARTFTEIRKCQSEAYGLIRKDAETNDKPNKNKTSRIFDMIPEALGNRKKRIVSKDISPNLMESRYSMYADDIDYLVNSGIALGCRAVTNPSYPVLLLEAKNLIKLYFSDVGLLTNIFYGLQIKSVMSGVLSVNLGSVYECVAAQELTAHGFELFYYENRDKGEADFLINDHENLSVLPLEIKSGKDYTVHSALNALVSVAAFNIKRGIVFSDSGDVRADEKIVYMPIYYVMFLQSEMSAVPEW